MKTAIAVVERIENAWFALVGDHSMAVVSVVLIAWSVHAILG